MNLLTKKIMDSTDMVEFQMANIIVNTFFYGMLQGYAFINCSDESLITYETYDLLYPIFSKYILSFCKADWEDFNALLDKCIHTYSFADTNQILREIDMGEVAKATKQNISLMEKLEKNKEMVKDLKDLMDMTNPHTKRVIDELQKLAVEESNNKLGDLND